MADYPSLPLMTDAYLADTLHLSLEQHGAYLKLLIISWRSPGCELDDDDVAIARMLGVTVKRWRAKLRPALAVFFKISDGKWRQKRLRKEYKRVERLVDQRRAAGRASALKSQDSGPTSVASPLARDGNETTTSVASPLPRNDHETPTGPAPHAHGGHPYPYPQEEEQSTPSAGSPRPQESGASQPSSVTPARPPAREVDPIDHDVIGQQPDFLRRDPVVTAAESVARAAGGPAHLGRVPPPHAPANLAGNKAEADTGDQTKSQLDAALEEGEPNG